MSSPSPSASALAVSSSDTSSSAAAAHWGLRWSSRAPPSLPTTMMPSALSSLRPQLMTKMRTLAHRWRSKACALAQSRMVPVNLPQPLRCCHCAAAVALCAAAALRAAATATDAAAVATLPPSCRRSCAVGLPPPLLTLPLPPRCHRHAVHRRYASRCRHLRCRCHRRHAAAKLPPTSRWRAAATADVPVAHCRHCQRRAVTLPPPQLTLPLPPRRRQAAADVVLLRCRHRRSLRAAATALPPSRCAPPPRFALPPPPLTLPSHRRQAAANVALSRCRHRR
jgi:hypothetical protein